MIGHRVKFCVESQPEGRAYAGKVAGMFTGTIVRRDEWFGDGVRAGLHIKLDRGGYLCILSDDDEPPPDWPEKLLGAVERAAQTETAA